MNPIELFKKETTENITKQANDSGAVAAALDFMRIVNQHKYSYNFSWMGRPIIQYPQDIIALQEIIWQVKPDLIIETGIAHGGSIIFSASMLELIGNDGIVIGIDIDIRAHNRIEIEQHSMYKRIKMIEGSSIDPNVIDQVCNLSKDRKRILVILDSNHTHEHVAKELEAYSHLVTNKSYLIVYDTIIEDFKEDYEWKDRNWGVGNNPKTAVWKFLKSHPEFEIDKKIQDKLLITVAPDGYLKRIG
ncbi:MAG: cephalosporin hydroxylase family protein [Bacteroidota bacterium]